MSQFFGPVSYGGDNSGAGPSGFWNDMPDALPFNRNIGIFQDINPGQGLSYVDCTSAVIGSFNIGAYVSGLYGYAGATQIDGGLAGGSVAIASDGDNEGTTFIPQAGQFKITAGTGKLWFEAAIATSTIADTKHNLFVGLYEPLTPTTGYPLSTSDALVDKNQIGFVRYADATSGNGSVLKAVYKKAGQTAQMYLSSGWGTLSAANVTTASIATLAAATIVKVGMKYDGSKGAKALSFFINGVDSGVYVTATNIAAATFPADKYMGFAFGVMNATGSTPGSSTLKWARIAQLV